MISPNYRKAGPRQEYGCVQFLQWSLPKLRMRWQGYRKVRGQVCKRINARIKELSVPDIAAYRNYLELHPDEWRVLDSLCRVTISRFYRDKAVFQTLEREVLPRLCRSAVERGERELRCWSIGCAAGEEPYTIAILWDFIIRPRFPDIGITVVATDTDPTMIKQARAGCYSASSLRELPMDRLTQAFIRSGDEYCIRAEEREKVVFLEQDVRSDTPVGRFHLVLCRNVVFTYFDGIVQREVLERVQTKIFPRGVLVIGKHETLPGAGGFEPWSRKLGIYLSVDKNEYAGGNGEHGKDGPAA